MEIRLSISFRRTKLVRYVKLKYYFVLIAGKVVFFHDPSLNTRGSLFAKILGFLEAVRNMEQPCQIGRKAKGEGSIVMEISFDAET